MIVLLLSNSKPLLGQTKIDCSSTGEKITTDTSVVKIPIHLIKRANAKMIERLYLIDLNNYKDSIINLKDKYIFEQQNIIINFKQRIVDYDNINNNIKKSLDKQRKRTKAIAYTAGGIILGIVVGVIVK